MPPFHPALVERLTLAALESIPPKRRATVQEKISAAIERLAQEYQRGKITAATAVRMSMAMARAA